MSVAVQSHGFAQLLKGRRVEACDCTQLSQLHSKIRRARAVPLVYVIIHALAVVQERKPRDDARVDIERARKTTTMQPHAAPMRNAVDAMVIVEAKSRPHDGESRADNGNAGGIHHGLACVPWDISSGFTNGLRARPSIVRKVDSHSRVELMASLLWTLGYFVGA